MKKKIFSTVATLLLSCYFAFAQNGGIPVEIKPLNPPTKPPYGNIIEYPHDSTKLQNPYSLTQQIIFECFQNSTHLTLQCNEDEKVEVVIYEMLSGIKYTTTLNMVAGEVYTIDTPWDAGLYTIRLTQTDGTILEGDFQIK